MANRQPRYANRSPRANRRRGDRPYLQHLSRPIMTSGHPRRYTALTDVTQRHVSEVEFRRYNLLTF